MSIALGLLGLALALAQEPPPDDGVDAGLDDEGVYEVRVYGPDAIREARTEVVHRMEGLGWRHVRTRKGDLVFRGPRDWMGRAILDRGGFLRFTSPSVLLQDMRIEAADTYRGPSAQKELAQVTLSRGFEQLGEGSFTEQPEVPTITAATGPSRKRTRGVRVVVLQGVSPALQAYRGAVQETAFQEQLQHLPDRLDALWRAGEPLSGGPPADTLADRRVAILDYWATRADTPQGHDLCRAIELWLEREVMSSADPVTAAEQAAANTLARDHHGRQLSLAVR